ncbi:allantoinase AllB [Acidothermaceae bacterium B102]|nr:allantoinase AllB [Acidothermaceae bacterium B102]
MVDTVFVGRRVVLPSGVRPCCVAVTDGRVVSVSALDEVPDARRTVWLSDDEVLLPGLVDSHVHLQNPGHGEWEDLATATRAALLGGVTTLVDMPVDSEPVTIDRAALAAKRWAMNGRVFTDVGLWAGVVPGNLGTLGGLVAEGVLGFKAFMVSPGLESFPPVSAGDLATALVELGPYDVPLLVHAEDASGSEVAAVRDVASAVLATGGRAHIVHVSDGESVRVIRDARSRGGRLTAETCPHYLVPPAVQPATSPPVRGTVAAQALWRGLAGGDLDIVVSDHSPGDPSGEAGPPGVAAAHLRLPLMWTALRARGLGLDELVRWCCAGPADLAGLPAKGRIAVGADADLCVFAPDQDQVVADARPTPYEGIVLTGVARQTWLRGVPADDVARGHLLRRG